MKRGFLNGLLVLMFCVVGCAPTTKEGYMEKYAEFMTEVSNSYSSYTDDDWADIEERFNQFKGEYYDKFKSELSTSEKIKLAAYEVKYAYYKSLDATKDFIDTTGIKTEVEETMQSVKDYIENDLENDLNEMKSETENVLNELGKETNQIIEDISSELESLTNN